jgi:hypothetical protein
MVKQDIWDVYKPYAKEIVRGIRELRKRCKESRKKHRVFTVTDGDRDKYGLRKLFGPPSAEK